jgi:hypothetical protein
MVIKFTYARGAAIDKVVIEASTVKEANRKGYAQCKWDSVLEATTVDDKQLIFPAPGTPGFAITPG